MAPNVTDLAPDFGLVEMWWDGCLCNEMLLGLATILLCVWFVRYYRMCEVALERLAGESARAYRLAQLYCELGAERSLARVQEAYASESGVVVSLRHLKRLSSRFRWVERARAWDSALASARAERMRRARLELEESVLAAARGVCGVLSGLGDGVLAVSSAGDVLRLAQALEVLIGLLPRGEGGGGLDVLGQLAALSRVLGGEGWRRVLMAEASAYGAGDGVG